MPRKVKATGVRRAIEDVDTESVAVAMWMQSKMIARDRRLAEERARRKRQERDV
jgi:hypothetical protein